MTQPDPDPGSMDKLLSGQYQLERRLSRSERAVVYEAADLFGGKVAIKGQRSHALRAPEESERFLNEGRILASLHHPGIVDIRSIVQEETRTYLVLGYVAGESLEAKLAGGPLSLDVARGWVSQIVEPLDHMHGRRIVHRNVQPSHILLAQDGSATWIGFGSARRQPEREDPQVLRGLPDETLDTLGQRIPAPRAVRGDPRYRAPEQDLGWARAESDLYALAACFYEALTGRLPFPGPDVLSQKRQMLLEPLTKRVPDLPPGLDEVFRRALHVDPIQRFRTGAEFASALQLL